MAAISSGAASSSTAMISGDMAAITAIYAESVVNGRGTFELEAPDETEMTARFAAVADLGLPRLVAEIGGRVVGYAYAEPFRTRQAYRYMVEDSIYVAPVARGSGVAGALLDALIRRCEAMGLRQMVAVIGDSDNLTIGEWVMSIGSPFGLEQSVATGIVSATSRSQIMSNSESGGGSDGGVTITLKTDDLWRLREREREREKT